MSGASAPSSREGEVVELRVSSWFLVSAIFTPAVLVVLGSWGLLRAGELRVFPALLLGLGLVLLLIIAVDLPYRAEVNRDGVDRICPLRRQRVPWDDVIAISRTRVDRGGQRLLGRAVARGPSKVGGLVLLVGPKRRRYLLTDRQERPDQFDRLQQAVRLWAPGVPLPAAPRIG